MALTTNTTLFSADGTFDPKVGFKGVTLVREVDFGMANVTGAVNYELLGIPKGFMALALGIEELEKCPSGTITAKVKGSEATLGSALTVGGDSLAAGVYLPDASNHGPKAFAAADMLCIVPSVAMTAGRIRVSLVGVLPNSDTRYSPELAAPWRKIGNTSRNVAEPDRLLGK